MGENFRAHIVLHLCPHDMSVISYEKTAVAVHPQQYQKKQSDKWNLTEDFIWFQIE